MPGLIQQIKHKLHFLLEDEAGASSFQSRLLNGFIFGIIIMSVVQIFLESYEHINGIYSDEFHFFEICAVGLFTIEYITRIWIADLKYPQLSPSKARLKFMRSVPGLIDLMAILPFYLPYLFKVDLRILRLLRLTRLLRILKVKRYVKALGTVSRVFYSKRAELGVSMLACSILLFVSATIMYYCERHAQPDAFPNIGATLWWALATLTTIGYGDVYPITPLGRIVSGVISILGIGLVALPTGIISSAFIEQVEEMKQQKKRSDSQEQSVIPKEEQSYQETHQLLHDPSRFNYCPHCGESLKPKGLNKDD